MDDSVVTDQWGCDVSSEAQITREFMLTISVRYSPKLLTFPLPVYVLVVSFGLVRITLENGPIEIAPGTHRMPRKEALRAVEAW